MTTQVQKWGNSLGIRIPQLLAKKMNLHSGSKIELTAKGNYLIMTKAISELDLLLDQINIKNRHQEIFNEDDNTGNESW